MVGLVIPIHLEGGDNPTSSACADDGDAKCIKNRKGSNAVLRKPLWKKNSRQKLRTFNIEIQLEGGSTSGGSGGCGRDDRVRSQYVQKTTPIPADMIRKNGISNKGNNVSVRVPSNKVLPRRSSSKDLRGAVIRRQSNKDLRQSMMRRQSSRDIVNNGQHKNVATAVVTKDPRICLIKRQSSQDMCYDRYTIRRDSINGLRIVSRDTNEEEVADKTIERLSDITITDDRNEYTKFQLDALKTHNLYRSKHKVASLKLDTELCKRAGEYADYLARSDTFEHSGDADYGENLYWSWSSDPRWVLEGAEPVTSWYDECQGYDYSREPVDMETGHFTQLVWSTTTHLGVGVTQSPKTGKFYVVMKYSPPGNIIGRYRNHVPPPSSS